MVYADVSFTASFGLASHRSSGGTSTLGMAMTGIPFFASQYPSILPSFWRQNSVKPRSISHRWGCCQTFSWRLM